MPEYRTIPLQDGLFALIDEADYPLVEPYKWFAKRDGRVTYAEAHSPMKAGRRSYVRMHRLITGATRGQIVDHRNSDGLDNRRANLRICTPQENSRHYRKRLAATSSKYKGVSYRASKRHWRALVRYGGVTKELGTFRSEHDAARAYDRFVTEHFGEFALTNASTFPEDFAD